MMIMKALPHITHVHRYEDGSKKDSGTSDTLSSLRPSMVMKRDEWMTITTIDCDKFESEQQVLHIHPTI